MLTFNLGHGPLVDLVTSWLHWFVLVSGSSELSVRLWLWWLGVFG